MRAEHRGGYATPRSMSTRPVIRSAHNPLIQRVRAVLGGREDATLALEGDRLIDDARAAGLSIEAVLVSDEREERARELEGAGLNVERVADDLLGRVSRLERSPGALALLATPPERPLSAIRADPAALVLAVAGVADPGNLGALARSAEAAGASALIVIRGGASPWNDKALRGSMGSLLRVPVHVHADSARAWSELSERGFRGVRAATRGGVGWERCDWRGPLIVWIGSETGGLPAGLAGLEPVTIPMRGKVESLNVAVAGSLLLFAAAQSREPHR